MSERNLLPGKFVWFELIATDAKKAQAFYGEVLEWKTMAFAMDNGTYEMILAGDTPDTMIGGYAPHDSAGRPAHWIAYVSVQGVDATAKAAAPNGGKGVGARHE